CTLPTQGMGSIISMVFISPEGFLPSILLLVVVIVTIVIVAVILVVIVVVIDGVVIVVMIIRVEVVVMIIRVVVVVGGVSFIIKLSLVIIGLEAVTFPSILLGNPPMKASRSYSVFGTMLGHKVANSWNLLISRTILIGQEPFKFSPGDLVGLLYSKRFGIRIPPRQGIIGESTSSKFHFAVLDTVTTRKYRFGSFKPTNKINSSFRTIEVKRDSHGDNGMRDPIGGLVSLASDEELEAPIKDYPLPTDASPTALLPGYIDDSNPEEDEEDPVDYPANGGDNDDNESSDDDDDDNDVEKDEEDPEEDPVDYPANGGDNDDNESSDDEDDDDDVEKDGEVNKEEEHLAPVDPSVVPIVDHVPSS
nr:hypothetical protein [Tanacetum cinerariifolium]